MSNGILPMGYQLLAQQFDMEHVKNGGFRFDKDAFKDRFKPSDITVSPPDWNLTMSKKQPSMSEEKFVEAITKQAQEDCANGYRRFKSEGCGKLRYDFVQAVSPDRKAIYEQSMSQTGGTLNITHAFYSDKGQRVLHFNTQEKQWMMIMTSEETARNRQFNEIYNKAYKAAYKAAQNGQAQSGVTPSVKANEPTPLTPIASYYTSRGLTPPSNAKESSLFSKQV